MASNNSATPISDATRRVLETKGPATPGGRALSRSELIDTVHDGSLPIQIEQYVEDRVPLDQNLLPQTQAPLNFAAGGFQQARVIRSEHINAMQDGAVQLQATADGSVGAAGLLQAQASPNGAQGAATTREPLDGLQGLQALEPDSVQTDENDIGVNMRAGSRNVLGNHAFGGTANRRPPFRAITAARGSQRSARARTTAPAHSMSTPSAWLPQATVTRSGRVSAPTGANSSGAAASSSIPLASSTQLASNTPTYFTAPALPSAPRRSRPSRAPRSTGGSGANGGVQVRTAHVHAHPNENFYHRGRGRWSRGLPPLSMSVRTAVRGPGAEAWLPRARAHQGLPTADSGGGDAAPTATGGGDADDGDDEDDDGDEEDVNGDEGDNEGDVDGGVDEDDNDQQE